ncbi:glycosyl hydrolase family 28-related protein [Bacillus cereus]|uniref:glycosyl hydrolase family 28-related protein n=1 Tax=Bacillus cereus TaxID=1396 RepID=UPI0015CF73F6|nr:glycosyl hydrolase family 28-related protein [Bacillus cereus]
MANIISYVNKIKTALYGKDVRGSLADGLEEVNRETEEATLLSKDTKKKQEHLETRWDEAISGITEDTEVIDARIDENGVNHKILKKRLDADSNANTQRLYRRGVDIVDFGADPTGNKDSTLAIKTAYAYAGTVDKKVYIPAGVFMYSDTIIHPTEFHVEGAGYGIATLFYTGTGIAYKMSDVVGAISRAGLSKITIAGNKTGEIGLYLRYLTNGTSIEDVEVRDFKTNIDFSKSWYSQFKNVRTKGGGQKKSWNIHQMDGQINGVSFITCQSHNAADIGFYIDVTHGCSFISCQSEQNGKEGFYIASGRGTIFEDIYTEQNGKVMSEPVSVNVSGDAIRCAGITFEGGLMLGQPNGYSLKIDKANDVIVMGTEFEVADANNRPKKHIYATENAKGVLFMGSVFSSAATYAFTDNVTILLDRDYKSKFPNGLETSDLVAKKIKTTNIDDDGNGLVKILARLLAKELAAYDPNDGQGLLSLKYSSTKNRGTVSVRDNSGVYENSPLEFLPPAQFNKPVKFVPGLKPNNPESGLAYFDSARGRLMIYSGNAWQVVQTQPEGN